jgi:hypothetical protein
MRHTTAVLFVVMAVGAMATGHDGDTLSGGALSEWGLPAIGGTQQQQHQDLGEAASPKESLPSGSEDPDPPPMDETAIDDAVIDETIKVPTFWEHCDFQGTNAAIETSVSDVEEAGIKPQEISSLKVPQDYVVSVYSEKNYMGVSKTFLGSSVHCLVNYNMKEGVSWDDQVQSIKVHSAKPGDSPEQEQMVAEQQAAQKEEELHIESQAKEKIKLRQEQLIMDQKKEQEAESRTKDEAAAESKVKAFQKAHSLAAEEEAASKVKVENAEANQQLYKQKYDAARAQLKSNDATLEQAKMRLQGAQDAQIAKKDAMEGEEKKYDAARQEHALAATPAIKSAKELEVNAAKRLLDTATDAEKGAKAEVNRLGDENEQAEKSVTFSAETVKQAETKKEEIATVFSETKDEEHTHYQAQARALESERGAKKSELDAKTEEARSKNGEKTAKANQKARDTEKELERKSLVLREHTSKMIRKKVAASTKDAKRVSENRYKKEKDAKFNKMKEERVSKELNSKARKHKEINDKAAVDDRVQELKDIRTEIGNAETNVEETKKHYENSEKTVDAMRKRRAEQDEESYLKAIKKRVESQKIAQNKEAIVKGKVNDAQRAVDESVEAASEFKEKTKRVEAQVSTAKSAREERSAELESRNKQQHKDAEETNEKAQKDEQEKLAALEKQERADDELIRDNERAEKTLKRNDEAEKDMRITKEVAAKTLRDSKLNFNVMSEKNAKTEYRKELKEKESGKKDTAAARTKKETNTITSDIEKAKGTKEKQAESLQGEAEELNIKKEGSNKKKLQYQEKVTKAVMKMDNLKLSVAEAQKAVEAAGETMTTTQTELFHAQTEVESARVSAASGGPGAGDAVQAKVDAAAAIKKKLDTAKQQERDNKNTATEQQRLFAESEKARDAVKLKKEMSEKTREKLDKNAKTNEEKSQSFKEGKTKDKKREAEAKANLKVEEAEASRIRIEVDEIKKDEIAIKKKKELDEKAKDIAIEKKKELETKYEKAQKALEKSDLKKEEQERKVAQAKEEESAARSKEAESVGKAQKVLDLDLTQRTQQMKAVTEKHTKEVMVKTERTMQKQNEELKNAEFFSSEAEKDLVSKQALVNTADKNSVKVQGAVTKAKEALQEAKDSYEGETDGTKKEMLKTKLETKQREYDDQLAAQRRVLDENMEVRLGAIRATRTKQKKIDAVSELRMKNKAYERSYKGVSDYSKEKIVKRKELEEKTSTAKKGLREREEKEKKAVHDEKFEKYMAKESVDKINAARKAEKQAVVSREKAKYQEYTSDQASDEKKRKAASKAVADAVDKKHERAKEVQEAFSKKSETQQNIVLMHEEKVRKVTRRMDEAKELLNKKNRDATTTKTDLGAATTQLTDAAESLKGAKSAEGKQQAEAVYAAARTAKDEKKQADDSAKEAAAKAASKVEVEKELEINEAKKSKQLKEMKEKTDERTQKATEECASAEHASTDTKEKYDAMQAKFRDMKLQEKSHKEVTIKKSKAMDIWSQLEQETTRQVDGGDEDLTKQKSPEDAKRDLAAELTAHQESSGTMLAKQILGTESGDDPNESEKEQKTAGNAKAEASNPLPANIMSHPILQYAKERKAKCQEADVPTAFSKERCSKAMHAAVHFSDLKTAAVRRNKGAVDTLEKWDSRVGTELKRYTVMEARLPKEEKAPELEVPKVPEEAEPEPPAPAPEEDEVVLTMPPSGLPGNDLVLLQEEGCDGLHDCRTGVTKMKQEISDMSASAENCNKNNNKLAAQVSGRATEQAATQAKLGQMLKTVKSLQAPTVSLGEAADVAATAAIKAARLHRQAHKLAMDANTPASETQEVVEKAARAKAEEVAATLAATQAATAE